MNAICNRCISAFIGGTLLVGTALAQHPVEVERLNADGEYLRAMAAFERLPSRRTTTASLLAAAQSAWALGLNSQSAKMFDRALQSDDLNTEQRARIYFSRAMIEFQLGKPELSAIFASKSAALLSQPSPLRAQVQAVWGKALVSLGEIGRACKHLSQAVDESPEETLGELHFELGSCFERVGRSEEARAMFERIPLEHDRAPEAVRHLVVLALEQNLPEQADFWLRKGRELFPDKFIDSWVSYVQAVVATRLGRLAEAKVLLDAATAQYPPSDPWFQLLRAVVEQALWRDAEKSTESYQSVELQESA